MHVCHRRPAVFPLAVLVSLVFATEVLREVVRWKQIFHSLCYGWMCWCLILWICRPWVIYRALVLDSQWWQGLYVARREKYNLNEPLLEVWGALRPTPASTLAVCLTDLEDDVVPIIPFGQLTLRTDHYFPGG